MICSKFVLFSTIFLVSNANIWMNIDVKKIDRKQCIVDDDSWGSDSAGCSKLTYMTIDERIVPSHERRSTSFEHILGSSRPTVTHWPRGKLGNWMMSMQFISVDPVYGIARTCDRSGYVRVFQEIGEQNVQFIEKTVKIEGQCFTATVHIQASTDICPWCVEEAPSTTSTVSTVSAPQTSSPQSNFLLYSIIFLLFVSFSALFGVTILLVLYIGDRHRRPSQQESSIPKTLPVFELPQPTVSRCSSFIDKHHQKSSWTTKSSGETSWQEYDQDQWISYQQYLKGQQHQQQYDYCTSPDSGTSTL